MDPLLGEMSTWRAALRQAAASRTCSASTQFRASIGVGSRRTVWNVRTTWTPT